MEVKDLKMQPSQRGVTMLLLTSNGLSSQALLNCVQSNMNNGKSAVIITTASAPFKKNDKHIPRLTAELESIGYSVDFFDFDEDAPKELLQYDLVEIIGGNPFYLLRSIRHAGAELILKQLAKEKILIGISAGSVVLQNSIRLIAGYSPEMNEGIGLTDLTGVGVTDLEILPHYHRFIERFYRFEERAKEYETANHCAVIRIDDGQGVLVRDNGYEIIGKENHYETV